MSKKVSTLLFDFDGTLINTNELIIQTFEYVLEKYHPGEYGREDILPFLGPTLQDTFNAVNLEKAEEMIHDYRNWNYKMHDELSSEFDGVSETLQKLKEANIQMGIVSTKRRDMVLKGLELLDVKNYFDTIVTMDEVTNAKPDPEPILLALNELEANKDETIMIGDNYHDIVGGKNAGVRTAGVAWTSKGEDFLQTFEPDYMLQHISDLLLIVNGEKV